MAEQLYNRSLDLKATKRAQEDQETSSGNLVLEFPFSSQEPYLRAGFFEDPWIEILGHKSEEVDLSRLNAGAPVLLNHGMSSTDKASLRSVGVTTRAWIENDRGYVEVKMSRRDGMGPLLQDIEDGIISNVSVGYRINERQLTKENKDSPHEYRVTRWQPLEVTLCDIPADSTVGIGRSINTIEERIVEKETMEEKSVVEPVIAQRAVETQQIDVEKIKSDALAVERKRITEIKQVCRSVSVGDDLADSMIERGISVEDARKEVLESLAKRSEKPQTSSRADIHTIVDETETRRELMAEAILHRARPNQKISDGARQYAGLNMIDMARECLEAQGSKTRGLDRMQIASRSFEGTSDLPNIMANVANKSLRAAYEAAPRTFTTWARQASAPDFKAMTRVVMSDAPALESVTENGEFKRGVVTDGKETYQLATVGKIIGLTRQALINDDLSAFTRIPAMFATAAANYESDTVYGILTGNAALSDGVALFHANHANLTGTGTAISVTSFGVARTMMRKQKTIKNVVMNLRPRYLIVPAALETIADQYVSSQFVANQSNLINPFAGAFEIISEARLDDNSATAWYLAADPSAIDTIEYCYLEGQNGVYIETRQGFDVDGMEIKARLDFAAKAIDYRGLYKNSGA